MSSVARQSSRSKPGVSLYLIGAALIGIALLGFIYSFLPAKTNSVEIDLGSKLARRPGFVMQSGSEEWKTVQATASATASPEPFSSGTPSERIFAPGRNGSLTVSWPTSLARGWPNLCQITYEPPRAMSLPDSYNVEVGFSLTSNRGLVHLFLDHNASAVIGTESPMTGVFADAFARKVFDALFAGDNIGTALWKARRHFLLEGRNPLGLAYTLYGRADAKLGGQKS